MRRALSQPNLAPETGTPLHEPWPQQFVDSGIRDGVSCPADEAGLLPQAVWHMRQLSFNKPVEPANVQTKALVASRSSRRSHSFKCFAPPAACGTTHVLPHAASGHAVHQNGNTVGSPCSLPPRAVMLSFLSAQGHVSAGRLAKPVCSRSSSCLSMSIPKEQSSDAGLSTDLVYALERQGRNSADAGHSTSLSNRAVSRCSMETDPGASTPPPHTPTLQQNATWPQSAFPCVPEACDYSAMHADGDPVGPGDDARARCCACCDGGLKCAAGRSQSEIRAGSAASTAGGSSRCCAELMHARPGNSTEEVAPLERAPRRDRPPQRAAEARDAAAAAAPAPPGVPTRGVAVAMSSMLFRPATAASATSSMSAVTAPDAAARGPLRLDGNGHSGERHSGESLPDADSGGFAAAMQPELEGRPSTDSAFQEELLTRVARARQTMDFAARQRATFGSLRITALPLWDALRLLDSLPPVAEQHDALSPLQHALLCAQWCAHEMRQLEWAPLVGLMHSLGRLLSHERFGGEPAWAVDAESYPLGCRFSEAISGHAFVTACPDRRCSAYATPHGIYAPHCGFDAMHFTWTAAEYLSLVVGGSGSRLPFAAAFLLRYQGFESAISEGAYAHLASPADEACMPTLAKFAAIRRAAAEGLLEDPPEGPTRAEVAARCTKLFEQYFPAGVLRF